MYAKSGSIEDAHQVFENLSAKDRIAWTAMIDGYAQHGQGRKALDLFNQMIAADIDPNGIALVSILNAFSHSGLVREGLCLFRLMSSAYGIKPVVNHYACVVDLLGRAGRLEEAFKFIITMPIEPNPTIWRSLLGACRNHKNLKLGICAAERLLDLEPEDDATYVLLANMYACAACWNKSFEARHAMKERGLRKAPGLSWLEVGKSFHVFGSSDSSHPQKEQIYNVLGSLMCEIKKAGYVPQTELALHAVGEEEKEKLLHDHSEKLAVALGLISTPAGSCIRIFKNLRICGDCHNAIKFISLLNGRKVVVRDVSRFHHFYDGACSCGDYW
uniref:Pentatricopeptide repeat-containing protein At3g49170, chloroplastic-like n=1 Tax=Elaeis guineensis var. tenera TaxID=51953 RepID=A0A6I9QGN7_ELAGV|nr:pentatricopeptide repeat-containing protein At3g49170, chloroplastic-like [Elaeis guineensis]